MVILVLAAVLLVMLAMNGLIFYILRTAVRTTEHQVREHFSRELTVFGDTVEEKQRRSMELDSQISDMKKEADDMKEIIDVLKSSPFYRPHKNKGEKLAPLAHYVDRKFFENYRTAKDLMAVLDKKAIVEEVQRQVSYHGDRARYAQLCDLIDTLNFDTVYQLETVPAEEQLQVLDETLKKEQHELFLEYVKGLEKPLNFSILSFLDWLRLQRSEEDPTLYVYTGEKQDNLDHMASNVKTCYDENICEGVRLVYQNQVYDYSICR